NLTGYKHESFYFFKSSLMVFNNKIIHKYGRHCSGTSIRRCSYHPSKRRVNLINAYCKNAHPFKDLSEFNFGFSDCFKPFLRVAVLGFPNKPLMDLEGPAVNIEPSRKSTFSMTAYIHGFQHYLPDIPKSLIYFFI